MRAFLARHKKIVSSLLAIVLLLLMVLLFIYVPPAQIIEQVGAQNVLLILFLLSLFSAISTFTSAPFYAALIGFVQAGLDPYLAALVVAPGVAIGDTVFFILMKKGLVSFIQEKKWALRFKDWSKRQPTRFLQIVIFCFFGFVPVSTDIFLSILALTHIRARDLFLPLIAGNFTFFLLISLGARSGALWIEKFLG